MGYRVAKSDNLSVKVQRVDGSCTNNLPPFFLDYKKKKKGAVLRCTLTGFERNYQA